MTRMTSRAEEEFPETGLEIRSCMDAINGRSIWIRAWVAVPREDKYCVILHVVL